jgi:hypothetical protein
MAIIPGPISTAVFVSDKFAQQTSILRLICDAILMHNKLLRAQARSRLLLNRPDRRFFCGL